MIRVLFRGCCGVVIPTVFLMRNWLSKISPNPGSLFRWSQRRTSAQQLETRSITRDTEAAVRLDVCFRVFPLIGFHTRRRYLDLLLLLTGVQLLDSPVSGDAEVCVCVSARVWGVEEKNKKKLCL